VHHAYTGDFVKYRNTHAGSFEQHIFHFHNHQWLFNPNDDNANYLDAQEIMPGSGHTYELVNGGAGNRNHTVGDAIFHCHFYPHFAQGMWYHQRNHDVFETGTVLAVSGAGPDGIPGNDDDVDPAINFHQSQFALRSGKPAQGARALPDGELPDGSPIPAIVPLPGKPMPQMPAEGVHVMAVDRGGFSLLGGRTPPDPMNPTPDSSQAVVDRTTVAGADNVLGTEDDVSPGYPFWLAGNECGIPTATNACPQGIVGQRMPTPPLDMLTDAGAADPAVNPALSVNEYGETVRDVNVKDWTKLGGGWDGGLPRHALLGYTAGGLSLDTQNRLDFRKIIELAQPVYFPETGTDLEQVSMTYQAVRLRPSVANNLENNGTVGGDFVLNGSPPVPGGPYNDPCVDDQGDFLRAYDVDTTNPRLENGPGDWYGGQDLDRWGTLETTGVSAFDAENPRTYKLANLQIDAVFNKVGHHYPQERIIILWEDVAPTIRKQRPPEPLVMRFNTFDCGKLLHANLVPHEFELDDFQVRTPTDIIGQHIHLPKWDLTTNDGAANGWNYEDGALAPGIVVERIHAINKFNEYAGTVVGPNCTLALALAGDTTACPIPGQLGPIDLTDLDAVTTIDTGDPGAGWVDGVQVQNYAAGLTHLEALPHPFFGHGLEGQHYTGARTVIQRILVDPVVNVEGVDRGLGLTFSHDHYGPSTFQQIGLYSTILAEPAGSTWVHNESGLPLGWENVEGNVDIDGFRNDGGPTSWQAAILPPAEAPLGSSVGSEDIPDHREFYFEMSDFQHAYEAGVYVGANDKGVPGLATITQTNGPFDATAAEVTAAAPGLDDPRVTWQQTVNPPLKLTAGGGDAAKAFPDTVNANPGCPGPAGQNDGTIPRPCAEAINIGHSSMWVVNYRNEPVGLRVFDPDKPGPDAPAGQDCSDPTNRSGCGAQADGKAGDLAFALMSRDDRKIPQMSTQVGDMPYPVFVDRFKKGPNKGQPDYMDPAALDPGAAWCDGINCDRGIGDPITPIMRAYERDHVKVKIQVGATEEQHQTTIHGLKWLSNGSGFGRSPNSGWRNFQSHGISEQFSLQVPITTTPMQPGDVAEYVYAQDATRDGMWTGTWGLLRAYRDKRTDLYQLPENPAGVTEFGNAAEFTGVCPNSAPKAYFDVSAVLANDVLPNVLGVNIEDPNPTGHVGGPLVTDENGGGTLVYNRRGDGSTTATTDIQICEGGHIDEQGNCAGGMWRSVDGPLNDPTAIMYVMTEDLEVIDTSHPGCYGTDPVTGDAVPTDDHPDPVILPTCPAKLKATAPVEPLVLRANAGDCIEVNLRNRLPEVAPDLAGWQDTFWIVKRGIQIDPVTGQPQMSFFGNNLIRPSSHVGLHPQLVAYDVNQHDGVQAGTTDDFGEEFQLAPPGGSKFYRWYAGHIEFVDSMACADGGGGGGGPGGGRGGGGGGNDKGTAKCVDIVHTPIEFGAVNLLSADRIKQPQKGLFGALVIEPEGATWAENTMVPDGQGTGMRPTRAQVTVNDGAYREAIVVAHKLGNLRWADGTTIKNVNQGEFGVEGAEDSGHAGFNYGTEPAWFRFKLAPDAPSGNDGAPNSYGSIPNPEDMYANALVAGEPNSYPSGDPATPVITTTAGMATRMHLLNGASADRDSTFVLHGHLWQRDPFICPGEARYGLVGLCDMNTVGSRALGDNPVGKYMGGEEGMGHVFGHWPILFDAGGTDAVPGDYLFRDYAPNGNRNGMFGILRVDP
jgi:hypothetical protein